VSAGPGAAFVSDPDSAEPSSFALQAAVASTARTAMAAKTERMVVPLMSW
jgi:hypothetical protein